MAVQDHISDELNQLKADANAKFQAKDYDSALAIYLDILSQLPVRSVQSSSPSGTEQDAEGESGDQYSSAEMLTSAESGSKQNAMGDADEAVTAMEGSASESEEAQIQRFRAVIYANIAAVQLHLEQNKEAVKSCNQSLLDVPDYAKAIYRRAQANERIGGWSGLSSALEDYKRLLHNKDLPASTRPSVIDAVKRLEPLVEEAAKKEKDEMIQKLKRLGDSVLGNFGLSTNNFKFTQQPGGGYSMNFVK
jgi:tetratricopeptide (TPR) repeat protein